MWIISAPLLAAQLYLTQDRLNVLDYLAVPVWAVGFFFEAVGDVQLARFKSNAAKKGKVLRTGVWRYTRHPNYFGDAAAGGGFWTIFSPILMTLFLRRVSGVALLEKTLTTAKPEYEDNFESTSACVPWFPKKR